MRNESQRATAGALIGGLLCVSVTLWSGSGAGQPAIPNFSPDSRTSWIAGDPNGENPVGQDFIPPESGPGPVTADPAHPHFDDGAARKTGGQPTYRVADLSNPILQPWVRRALQQANERA